MLTVVPADRNVGQAGLRQAKNAAGIGEGGEREAEKAGLWGNGYPTQLLVKKKKEYQDLEKKTAQDTTEQATRLQ